LMKNAKTFYARHFRIVVIFAVHSVVANFLVLVCIVWYSVILLYTILVLVVTYNTILLVVHTAPPTLYVNVYTQN
jgi:hypothetical protein